VKLTSCASDPQKVCLINLEEYLSHLLRHKDKVTCLYEKYKYIPGFLFLDLMKIIDVSLYIEINNFQKVSSI